MNTQKIILSISTHQCLATVWHGKHLLSHQVFSHDETAYAAFDHFLLGYTKYDVFVMVDAMEEEYRIEALPHVVGTSRRAMIERKLSQFSRNCDYRAAQWIGQGYQKRREDVYLFASLTNTEFMQVWIDLMQQRAMSLVGVYLLPLTLPYIVQQMKLDAPNLLLCEKLSSGLRQTYLNQGRVRLSRLISMQHIKPEQLAYFYLVEIEKTRLYLLSQRLIDDKTDLQLILPSLDENSALIAKSISQEQGLESKIIDVQAFVKNQGLQTDTLQDYPELMHMQMLANGYMPPNMAPQTVTFQARLKKTRFWIRIASAVMVSLSLASVLMSILGIQQNQAELKEIKSKLLGLKQHHQQALSQMPASPLNAIDLKQVDDVANRLQAQQVLPERGLELVQYMQEKTKGLQVLRLNWAYTNQLDWHDFEKMPYMQQRHTSNSQIVPRKEIMLIEGRLKEGQLATFNTLQNLLKTHAYIEQLEVLQALTHVDAQTVLVGNTAQVNLPKNSDEAKFKLKLVLKSQASQTSNVSGVTP